MAIVDALLGEIEHEAENTRRLLEVVPADKLGWQPHEKSMTLGRLAGHIAEAPGWVRGMAHRDELDFDSPEMAAFAPYAAADKEDLLATFERQIEVCRQTLTGLSDEAMMGTWTARRGEKVLMQMPRLMAIKGMVLNHTIHHRGQLTVYLRLLDVPLPPIYGPTADAEGF
ncbi:MAG: DUF664 domain-containing protein [Acidobacteria bacterium]|nr:MAG: DUF664 domain-containing protein [Acidobacteriota bacterium]